MKLRIAIIECPYDMWASPEANSLFVKTVGLKFNGYKAEYPYGVLPVDTTDFVGTHHLVCKEEGKTLTPLMAYKSITLARSKIHNMTLPTLNMTKSCNLPKHTEAVQKIINRCEKNKSILSYDSSWTIDPQARKDKELTAELRSVMTSIHVMYHVENKTSEILSGGALRFKMDKLFTYWGYKNLSLNNEVLEAFTLPTYFNEKINLFHMDSGFSNDAINDAHVNENMWRQRIVLESREDINFTKIAA